MRPLVLLIWLLPVLTVAQTQTLAQQTPPAPTPSAAPGDTSKKDVALDEVVVTATRSNTPANELPVPMTVVDPAQIRNIGSPRLTEVLQEQLGVSITSSSITQKPGIQLQGLSAEYVLILVDGEPLVGREVGTLDLDRLAVAPIERVEIVKGAVSSLYGSDALGGVVNIITRAPMEGQSVDARIRSGSNDTWDGSLGFGYRNGGFSSTLMGNYYSTQGFAGQAPTKAWTLSTRESWLISPRIRLGLTARYADQRQQDEFTVTDEVTRQTFFYSQELRQYEYGIIPSLTYYGDRWKLRASYYEGRYNASDPEILSSEDAGSRFDQTFRRPELIAYWTPLPELEVIAGGGAVLESLERALFEQRRHQETAYGFTQLDYSGLQGFRFIAGARFDAHSVYGNSLNPKFGVQFHGVERLRLNASVGTGFKAPDFRQLYFNFVNPAGGGYSVAGSEEIGSLVQRFEREGYAVRFVGTLSPERLRNLKPERGISYQAGATYDIRPNLTASVNGFWHQVDDRIETQLVANRALDGNFGSGPQIFSYINIDEMISRGIETEIGWNPVANLRLSAGYLFLDVYDPTIRDLVTSGNALRVDPATGQRERIRRSDYGGLFGRSRHSGNLKATYTYPKWGLTLSGRVIARSRYGQRDVNGNDFLDLDAEYAPGYLLGNFSASKSLGKHLSVQTGLDNAFNFTDPDAAPFLAGRLWFVALDFHFNKP